jgi:hypothetical protein
MIKARLFKHSDDPKVLEEEANKLFKLYVFEELIHSSCSIRAWRRTFHEARNAICDVVLGKNTLWPPYPSVSTLHLKSLIDETQSTALYDVRCQLVDALVMSHATSGGTCTVDIEKLKQGQPQTWQPVLIPQDGQSLDSQTEQRLCLKALINAINEKVDQQTAFVKGPLLIGKPGAGKTFLVQLAVVYALSRGLNVLVLALTGQRALEVGGSHIHRFFCIQEPSGQKTTSAARIAESAMKSLVAHPEKTAVIKNVDLVVFEEIGLIPLELLSAVDRVMQYFRKSQAPFGSCLATGTGDNRQLRPVQGKNVWLSGHLMTTFDPYVLRDYVRCATDRRHQELNNLIHKPHLRPEEVEEFCNMLRSMIRDENVVKGWQNVKATCTKMVGKREAVRYIQTKTAQAREVKIKLWNRQHPQNQKASATVEAKDFIQVTQSQTRPADASTVALMSAELEEPQKLLLTEGGVYQFTYNDSEHTPPHFTHGQLSIVEKINFDGGM